MADRRRGARPHRAVVLTALQLEFEAVRAHLTDVGESLHPAGTVYERGTFMTPAGPWQVTIVQTGAGNAEAAQECERAIDYVRPQVVLFVGVAGGIKDVRLGDVVAATKVYNYESGKAELTFAPRPHVGRATYRLEERAKAEARNVDWLARLGDAPPDPLPRVHVGPIAAGEKIIASTQSETFRLIRAMYGDALAVEMEGAGFLGATRANQHVDALVVRGISDLIDQKSVADAAGSQETAARHASAFAFEVLAKLIPPDPRRSTAQARPAAATAETNRARNDQAQHAPHSAWYPYTAASAAPASAPPYSYTEPLWRRTLNVMLFATPVIWAIAGTFLADGLLRWASSFFFNTHLQSIGNDPLLITGCLWAATYLIGAIGTGWWAFLTPLFDMLEAGRRLRALCTLMPVNVLLSLGAAQAVAWAAHNYLAASYNRILIVCFLVLSLWEAATFLLLTKAWHRFAE